jgi:hypothetical protein
VYILGLRPDFIEFNFFVSEHVCEGWEEVQTGTYAYQSWGERVYVRREYT